MSLIFFYPKFFFRSHCIQKTAKLFINNVWWHYQFFSSINSSPSQQHSNMFIWWNQIFVWWVILILAKKLEYQVSEQINNAARSGTLYENVHCWNSMINASTDWQASKHWLAIRILSSYYHFYVRVGKNDMKKMHRNVSNKYFIGFGYIRAGNKYMQYPNRGR